MKLNNYLPDPLPDSEWNFTQYKSELEITQAFYYEYLRSCEALHPIILGGRQFWSRHLYVPEEIKLTDSDAYFELVKKLPGGKYFEFVSAIDEFPMKPLSQCKNLGLIFSFYGHHTSPEPLASYSASFFEQPNFSFKKLQQISADCYNNPFYGKKGYGLPVLSIMGINWGATDKEILEYFIEFLKSNRPDQFKGLRHPLQRGLGDRVLPFKKDTAIDWLSVWRRKEKGFITWDQFIDLYDPIYDHPNNPHFGKKDNRISALKKMNAKAKKILRWFAGENIPSWPS